MNQVTNPPQETNPLEKLEGKNIMSLTYEELTDIYPQIQAFSVRVYQMRMLVMQRLIQFMLDRKASKVFSNGTVMTLKTDAQREYDYDLLESKLQPLISEQQWSQIISYEPKVSWAKLKEMRKVGGEIGEIVNKSIREQDKHYLSVSNKSTNPSFPKHKIYPAEVTGGEQE